MTLICDDCMNVMKDYPDKYFDLAIVDPPYGIKDKIIFGGEKGLKIKPRTELKKWDIMPSKNYFNELFRISKNQIIWGGNYFVKYIYHSRGWIVWDKLFPNTFNRSKGELAWSSFNKNLEIIKLDFNGGVKNYSEIKIHGTQKPIKLYVWLLNIYAKEDYKILDTHLGSGSHAIAWHYYQKGGEFVGIEIDKEYFEAAKKRIEKNTHQLEFNFDI